MVSVAFKTMYLFLALFALPQVLGAPGTAALSLRAPVPASVRDEVVAAHNTIRARHHAHPLTWSRTLEAYAAGKVAACNNGNTSPYGQSWSYDQTFMATIGRWMAVGGPEYYQIISQTARQVGCAIGKCDVPDGRFVVCAYNPK